MKEESYALWSEYIIDGVRMGARPVDMLSPGAAPTVLGTIVDESLDLPPGPEGPFTLDVADCLALVSPSFGSERGISPFYAAVQTKFRIASALIDIVWKEGHFRLCDLVVNLHWHWDIAPVGAMAAFYRSAEAACEYLDGLGVRIAGYSFEEGEGFSLGVDVALEASAEEDFEDYAERVVAGVPEGFDDADNGHKALGLCRKCPARLGGASSTDWIFYLPFDTCDFRLGGSLLNSLTGQGGAAPDISDPDYFIDCFELLREMVEDGIVKAGVTVTDGGLMTSLSHALLPGVGLDVDLSGVMRGQEDADLLPVLFSELPGALIEVNDQDYDYIDAEFLLQDVAYFPLGHLSEGGGLRVVTTNSLSGILRALLDSQVSEGED